MKELIKQNEFGISVLDKDKSVRVDSRYIAEVFGKLHKDVIKAIRNITSKNSGYSEEFSQRNFALVKYADAKGEKRPMYLLTRDGFTALVFGFTGAKANQFKEWYINRFNEMEERLHNLEMCRLDCRKLTDALLANGKNKWYHYSNEFNMINSLVLGMSTKKIQRIKWYSRGY